jgi:colanic acid/amylovoran biosynthesis glycosyltransferase
MHLGYLIPDFPTQTHVFFWREIQALRGMGEQVFLVSTRRPSPSACRHEFAQSATKETHYLYPPSVANLASWAKSGRRGLQRALEYLAELESAGIVNRLRQYGLLASAIDLVEWASQTRISHLHGHSCANSAHVLALANRLGGPSYSLTLHGDPDIYGGDYRSKMKDAAFICVVGSHLVTQIQEKANVAKVIVTCMGVKTEELAKLGKDRAYISGQLHVATVARLHPAKGHLHALSAVNRAHRSGLRIHYTIAGEGPHKETIVSKIRELGLENQVTLSGSLSETEVYQLLSKVDAFLLPSAGLGEAWPVSVMEAMGAGLPVIASIVGATPEMITPDKNGFLVPQRDEEALFNKIMLLGANLDLRRRIGTAARHTACQHFDVSVTANILREAVQRVVAANNSSDLGGLAIAQTDGDEITKQKWSEV